MIILNIILLSVAAAIAWWLSGYDARVTGENERADLIRRAMRSGITLLLVEAVFWILQRHSDLNGFVMLLVILLPLGLLWGNCIGDLVAGGFHRLVDPQDNREFDPNKGARDLDMVASLLKSGRKEEAMQLCELLKESGDANVLVLETLLARSGIHQDNSKKPRPLTEAHRLRSEGKFDAATEILNSMLAENPSNVDAALMLMRLYAQDLKRSDKAAEILRSLEKQPHIPSGHIEYAQRSIHEWSRKKIEPEAVTLPESIDELLACGYLGTATEILERKIKEQPGDFDSWLKLAEVHGRHCGDFRRAKKIVQQIEADPGFSAGQINLAQTKLQEWRETKPQKK